MTDDPSRICLATVTSPDFIAGSVVLVHSFLHCHPELPVDVVVIHDGLDNAQATTIEALSPRVRLQCVSTELRTELDRLVSVHPDMAGRRARFHSIDAFGLTGYRKVLFCDSDLLFRSSVAELFSRPEPLLCCGDAPVHRGHQRDAATFTELASPALADRDRSLGQTFNAGLLLIDGTLLGQQTHRSLVDAVMSTDWSGIRSGHTDQVLLNRLFDGRQTLVDPSFNFLMAFHQVLSDRHGLDVRDARVLHFNGPVKPWMPARLATRAIDDPVYLAAGRMWTDAYWSAVAATHMARLAATVPGKGVMSR